MSSNSPATSPATSPAPRPDPRTVLIAGLTTFAWYAVPDVVRPRWARALAKTAVSVAGAALVVSATRDGRAALAAARDLRDQIRSGTDPSADGAPHPGHASDALGADCPACSDNPAPIGPAVDIAEVVAPRPGVVSAVAAGGAVLAVAASVAGERWVYRRAEGLRARGVRRPHVLVGLGMGVIAAGLTAVDVPSDRDDVTGSATPR